MRLVDTSAWLEIVYTVGRPTAAMLTCGHHFALLPAARIVPKR